MTQTQLQRKQLRDRIRKMQIDISDLEHMIGYHMRHCGDHFWFCIKRNLMREWGFGYEEADDFVDFLQHNRDALNVKNYTNLGAS